MAERPLGVTVACILGFVGAAFWIAMGALTARAGSLAGSIAGAEEMGMIAVLAGSVSIIVGIILLLGLYWTWKLRKRGWAIVMVFGITGLAISSLSVLSGAYLDAIGIIIPLVLVIYLYMKRGVFFPEPSQGYRQAKK